MPQFNVSFARAIFDNQFGNLPDVSNPVVLEVANFYSSLGPLPEMATMLNVHSADYLRAKKENDQPEADAALRRIDSVLLTLAEEIAIRRRVAEKLLTKLSV